MSHCSLLTTRQRRSTVIMWPNHCHCLPSKRPRLQVEHIADPVVPFTAISARVAAKSLVRIYRIATFDTAEAMIWQIAAVRGKLRKVGTPNLRASSCRTGTAAASHPLHGRRAAATRHSRRRRSSLPTL
jgi:hypothetical protein